MRIEGLSLTQIGAFVAALFVPWSFKWLWAPVIDIVKLQRFGGRKAWITLCTVMMIITLVVAANVDFARDYRLLLWMIVLNNFFCATQDVAIDSLAVSTLKKDEWAAGNGFMFGGQYFGIAVGGGGAIFVSSMWGFTASLIFVSTLLFTNLIFVTLFIVDKDAEARPTPREVGAIEHLAATLGLFFRDLYAGIAKSGRGPKLGLIFAVLPVGAMALAYATLGTIQVDYGLSQSQISGLAGASSLTAGLGCLLGGLLGGRFGVKRITGIFYFATIIPTLYLAHQISTVGLVDIPIQYFYTAILAHSFLFGMGYAVRIAIFMGMTNPAVAATQFTAYMALSNVAISVGNLWQGSVAENFDYAMVFYLDSAFVVFALAILPFLKDREVKVPASKAPTEFDALTDLP